MLQIIFKVLWLKFVPKIQTLSIKLFSKEMKPNMKLMLLKLQLISW